jgi:hypothetical protein
MPLTSDIHIHLGSFNLFANQNGMIVIAAYNIF